MCVLEWWLCGSGAVVVCRWSDYRKIPHAQGQRSPSKTVGAGVVAPSAGAAVRSYPTFKGKGEAQQDSRRGEIVFRIKPRTRQRRSECSNKPCVHQNAETPQRLRQNCVWVSPEEVWSAVDCCGGRGSGCSRPGYVISLLGGGYH